MPYPTSQAVTAQADKRSQKKDTPEPHARAEAPIDWLRGFGYAAAQQVNLAV